MNPTHETDDNPAQPPAFGENFLVDLFTDKDSFRAGIASAAGTAAQSVPGPETSPVLGLPMTDADRRRYALREAGYTGWVDNDGNARTEAEFTAWSAFMSKVRSGWFPAEGGGYVLTDAGREVLAKADTAAQFALAEAWVDGVSPDQIGTEEWDGEPLFEWLSDHDADEADSYGERLAERCLAQAEAADAAEAAYVLTDSGRVALDTIPSTCPVDLVTVTDDEVTALVLRSAATYLERYGWVQGAYFDPTATIFTPAADMVGAIGMVCYGGPVEAPAQHFDDPGFLDFEAAVLHLDRYLLAESGSESYDFNDARGRRLEDVTRVLRDAAVRPAHELIDALRAIDRHNADVAATAADMAVLAERVRLLTPNGVFAGPAADECWCDCPDDSDAPCCPDTRPCSHCIERHPTSEGVWDDEDDVPPEGHIERPHLPGNLFGCPTCEERCFCNEMAWRCVYCALQDQRSGDATLPGGDVR